MDCAVPLPAEQRVRDDLLRGAGCICDVDAEWFKSYSDLLVNVVLFCVWRE